MDKYNKERKFMSRGFKQDLPKHIVLSFFALLTFYPFFLLAITSFKTNKQFYNNFWAPTFPLHFENYVKVWGIVSRYIMNSLVYSGITLIIVIFISALTGFTFARYKFIGKRFLYLAILLVAMLPSVLLMVPMFSMVSKWHWLDQPYVLIIPWAAMEISIGTFIMKTFFESQPNELFEAARLDGASEVRIFVNVALPLAKPALGTVAIMDLLFTWNDIVWPLVSVLSNKRFPTAAGMLSFRGQYMTVWGKLFAGYTLASLPLIIAFIFATRYFIEGLKGGIGTFK